MLSSEAAFRVGSVVDFRAGAFLLVFFATFFGLTGTILHLLGQLGPNSRLGASVATGAFSGMLVSWLVRTLRNERVDSNIDPLRDYVGREGEVILAIEADSPGRVRLNVKGCDIDLSAITEGGATLSVGTKVKVQRYSESLVCVLPLAEAA